MNNSFAMVHPELIAEWSEKNLPLTPDTVTYGSNKVMWWKGACGHEWQSSIKSRSAGEKCPICSGARVVEGINDLATLKPELAKEWSEKNYPLMPNQVMVFANRKAWWKCKRCGNECTAKDGVLTIKDTTNGTEYAGTYEVADESKDSVIYNVVIGEDTGTAVSSVTKADDGSEAPTLIIAVDEYSLTFYE